MTPQCVDFSFVLFFPAPHVAHRYTLNWVKMQVWEQVQCAGIIMIDVDVTVLGALTHLFHLPTDFAAVPDNGKVWNRWAQHPSSPVTSLCNDCFD